MTDFTSDSHTMIKRLVPPLALWIASKILEAPRVKTKLAEVDSRTYVSKKTAARMVRRVGRNARRNPAWLAAAAAALAVAIGCMAKAGSKPKR